MGLHHFPLKELSQDENQASWTSDTGTSRPALTQMIFLEDLFLLSELGESCLGDSCVICSLLCFTRGWHTSAMVPFLCCVYSSEKQRDLSGMSLSFPLSLTAADFSMPCLALAPMEHSELWVLPVRGGSGGEHHPLWHCPFQLKYLCRTKISSFEDEVIIHQSISAAPGSKDWCPCERRTQKVPTIICCKN